MSDTDVTVEQHGEHVGLVCLHRPPNNYFDTGLIEAVATAYEELDDSGWCRAIVLASEGRHFCAGLDFAANAGQDIAALYRAASAPLRGAAARGGRRAGCRHRRRLRARALGGLPGGDPADPLQRQLRPPRLPPRLRPDGDTARRRRAARPRRTCCSPAGASAAMRRWRSGCAIAWPATVTCLRRPSPTRASWRRPGRSPCAPSGPPCAAAWWRRPASPWSTSARSRPACATRPTSPRACGPRRSGARPAFGGVT